MVIFLTGVGTRTLFKVLETRHPRAEIVAALARSHHRGARPEAGGRDARAWPRRLRSIPRTQHLARGAWRNWPRAHELAGKRVAVQEYGVPNRDLIAGLEARGAKVMSVPVYRWALPDDRGPLRAALKAIAGGKADVVLFTSSHQVTNVHPDGRTRRSWRSRQARARRDGRRIDRAGLLRRNCAPTRSRSTWSLSIPSSAI